LKKGLPVFHLKLLQNVADVKLNRPGGYIQCLSNVFVRKTSHEKRQDLFLPHGHAIGHAVVGGVGALDILGERAA
jgi:hypothetical protein